MTTNNDPKETLQKVLSELSLKTVLSDLDSFLDWGEREAPGYSRFLERILTEELRGRKERRLENALRQARLKNAPSLDDYDFSIRPKLSAKAVKELATCRFVDEGRNILCLGKPSTGKTFIARALGRCACLRGLSVQAKVTADLLDELHAAEIDGSARRIWQRYVRCRLLILDELGYLPLDERKANMLFRLVSARYEERRSIVVTSNTTFRRWGSFFPNEAQAVATVERLIDRATILRFSGKGCRGPQDIFGAALDDE